MSAMGMGMTNQQQIEPRRLAKEAELMYRHTRAKLVEEADGSIHWIERLVSEGGEPYTLAVRYPPGFPFRRPRAFVLQPNIDRAPHHFEDGSLCLFDESSAVDVKCTALVVRNRAVTWFLAYEVWKMTGKWSAPEHGSRGAVP